MSTITDTMDGDDDEDDAETMRSVPAPVRFVGFWAAIALPFMYVPLLATGLESPSQLQTFLLLLALNVVALLLGHRHDGDT
ncbi:hypothetical protein DMJ13_07475 [halophilic archaeon]|nr:hypothetical protein DMJ13_07475 [halophilic archaeon]